MTYEEQIIRIAMKRAGITTRNALSERVEIDDQTMRKRMRSPEKITLGELRRIAQVTRMTAAELLLLFKGEGE